METFRGDGYTMTWRGDEFALLVGASVADGLAEVGADALDAMQAASPYLTGSLQSSLRPAEPGYAGDDTPLYDRTIDGVGVYPPIWTAQMVRASVRQLGDRLSVWVGSWIYYAYWVERGYFNAWARRAIAGRNFIIPNAEAAFRGLESAIRAAFARRVAGQSGRGR